MDLSPYIQQQVAAALAEDVGSGDLTVQLVPAEQRATATVICREQAVVCGIEWFMEVFIQLDSKTRMTWQVRDGDGVEPNQVLCRIEGDARAILTGERTALNFLQTLSATATRAREFMQAIAGTKAVIVDTRKTIPGLRLAQKYAVRVGGAANHRTGLYDGVLIKENHIMAAGGITAALREAARRAPPDVPVQVEVETLAQLEEALNAGAKLILLDNFELNRMREAVALNAGRAKLEASGGVSLQAVRAIAQTGVDRISVGALTKDIKAIDLSLRFQVS